jgi:hypothetical protein
MSSMTFDNEPFFRDHNGKPESPPFTIHEHIKSALTIFFFERQIYYYNSVSVQGEQRPIKERLHNKCAVYRRNTWTKPKVTPPKRLKILIPYLEWHSIVSKLPNKTPTKPKKMQLDTNSRSRIKSDRPINIQKQLHAPESWWTTVERRLK